MVGCALFLCSLARHTLKGAPRPGLGPSEKVDPGPLEKTDPIALKI